MEHLAKLEQQAEKVKAEIIQVEADTQKMENDIRTELQRKSNNVKTKLDTLDRRMTQYWRKKGKLCECQPMPTLQIICSK